MRKAVFSFFVIMVFLTMKLTADEGMYLLKDIHKLDLASKGLNIPVSAVYSTGQPCIAEAVCQVGGGSGSFVSPEGLILTNHHVAFGAVQRSSVPGRDLIRDGYLAMTREEEIPAKGYEVRITLDYIDVTDRVLAALKKADTPLEVAKALEAISKKIVAEYEKKESGIECNVREMYGGFKYYLFKLFVIKDIRIVYVPPRSIGEYGGETDNWMWPRHTGDFSYLRAYVSKNGKPVEYSKDNTPYKPRTWLKIAKDGLKDNDFVFIMGYPGSTERYQSSYQIEYLLNYIYPWYVKNNTHMVSIMDGFSAKSDEARLKLASLTKRFNNTLKNYQGRLDGFKKINLLEIKKGYEKRMEDYFKSDPAKEKEYKDIFTSLDELYKRKLKIVPKELALRKLEFTSRLLEAARRLYKYSIEKEKPDLERDEGYQERDVPRIKRNLSMATYSLYALADIEMFIEGLKEAASLPAEIRIEPIYSLVKDKSGAELDKTLREFAERAYAESRLKEPDYLLTLFSKSTKELLATGDPFIRLAASIYNDYEWLKNWEREQKGILTKIEPKYISALRDLGIGGAYPDANATVRFTYGYVKGYKPRDAVVYLPFTTFSGVIEKDTGKEPFNVPEKLKELHKATDLGAYTSPILNNDVPVAFLSDTDITGGNSGSPIMNSKGELAGLIFDGNYEALTSDFLFQPELTRSISVDIRYILFITDKFAGAKHLLSEMGIK